MSVFVFQHMEVVRCRVVLAVHPNRGHETRECRFRVLKSEVLTGKHDRAKRMQRASPGVQATCTELVHVLPDMTEVCV